MLEIEEFGPNAVRIGDRVIPCWDIQVEGYPKIDGEHTFPIYFEVPFEYGDLWVVSSYGCFIEVKWYMDWAEVWKNNNYKGAEEEAIDMEFCDWKMFLDNYQSFISYSDQWRNIEWRDILQ